MAEWTPFQTHYFSENPVVPEIESRTSAYVARNSGHQTTEKTLKFTLKRFITKNFQVIAIQTHTSILRYGFHSTPNILKK
jgi:hypothetical protein